LHIVHKIYTHAHRERERKSRTPHSIHEPVHAQLQIYKFIAELLLSKLQLSVIQVV